MTSGKWGSLGSKHISQVVHLVAVLTKLRKALKTTQINKLFKF